MSLHGRIIGEKIGGEGVKGSNQWSSVVIHMGIFFVQQQPRKGGEQ